MKILVLCHANMFRSPLCAAVLKQRGLEVQSAGFSDLAARNLRAAKKVRDLAIIHGYDLSEHRAQLVKNDMVVWANKIVIMDGGNEKRFLKHYAFAEFKLVRLGSMVGATRIPDLAYFSRNSKQLSNTVDLIINCSNILADQLMVGTENNAA